MKTDFSVPSSATREWLDSELFGKVRYAAMPVYRVVNQNEWLYYAVAECIVVGAFREHDICGRPTDYYKVEFPTVIRCPYVTDPPRIECNHGNTFLPAQCVSKLSESFVEMRTIVDGYNAEIGKSEYYPQDDFLDRLHELEEELACNFSLGISS